LWDKKQTHRSLIKDLREEVEEYIEAVRKNNHHYIKEELGDILLHVMFSAQIASKDNKFNIEDVIEGLINKIKRRHPHVFGALKVHSTRQIIANWNRIKKQEKHRGA
jgi:tetrapyrrole methylase family protein/MazG family protein